MNRKFVATCVLSTFYLCLIAKNSFAGGEVSFPTNWEDWVSVDTALTKIGALQGCDANVSALPPIYQETAETYCNVTPQGPGALKILVRPDVLESYKNKNGRLMDGPSMILQLIDLQVLFVSGIVDHKPSYSVFKNDGTDITSTNPSSPFSANTCRTCHSGYTALCSYGQCGSVK